MKDREMGEGENACGDPSGGHTNTDRVTWEGCSVLLDINEGDRLVFARLSPAAFVKIGNKKLSLSPLVGCPFGSSFQVEIGSGGARLALVRATTSQDASVRGRENGSSNDECLKDNRALIDNNTAQGLSGEDIDKMRSEGATGDEIIEALIANSSTFENKTVFSQEKYRLKKQKKYAPKVLLRRPFTRSICEAYFKKNPSKIGFLRMDTLSLLLSAANVNGYSDVLVVDKVGGMVAGAVAERLGSAGKVCCTHFGSTSYPLNIVKIFNFSADHCHRILQVPFSILSSHSDVNNGQLEFHSGLKSSEVPKGFAEEPFLKKCAKSGEPMAPSLERGLPEEASSHSLDLEPTCTDELDLNGNNDGIEENIMHSPPRTRKSANPGGQASLEAIKLWEKRGFTSLIVAAPELDTETIVQDLLPLLAYSAPFAIYHQYLQPLAACMHKLQSAKLAIGLQISEPWLREYQVLPSRTHPHMQMSGSGGYILSGIRIFN